MRRHDRLALAAGGIGPERHPFDRASFTRRDLEPKRRAGVIMPNFHRVDSVPVRALPAREQKIVAVEAGRPSTMRASR